MARLPRVIPVMLLSNRKCIKTVRFRKRTYVGDPMNILRIFNDKEVDELVVLDIDASKQGCGPDISYINQIAAECFMPLTYGGGISTLKHADSLFAAGVDKICMNSSAATRPELISSIANTYGTQAVVISVDARKNIFGKYVPTTRGGTRTLKTSLKDYLRECQNLGCGEIFLNSVHHDGMQSGYDIRLIDEAVTNSSVPVVACGGAAQLRDFHKAVCLGNAAAVAAGSMFVFQGPHRAVLISYPRRKQLEELFHDERSKAA